MGNKHFWKGTSEELLIQTEVALIKRSGLKDDDWHYHNINVDPEWDSSEKEEINFSQELNTQHYLHCVEIKRKDIQKDLPVLVLTHGYGAGIGIFYRILYDLGEFFHIYAVDLLGMGASGRPPFTATEVSQAEDFFVEPLRRFIIRIGINSDFYLAGHSLGGYIVSVYALKYPENILKLLLLSPVGIPEKPSSFNPDQITNRYSLGRRIFMKTALKMWNQNFTPFKLLRGLGPLGSKGLVGWFVGKRMEMVTEEEKAEIKEYLHQIFMRDGSGEYALNTILEPGAWARCPLYHRIQTLQMPSAFYYGQYDWMDPAAPLHLIEAGALQANLYFVEGCDHHVYMANPTDFIFKIVQEVYSQEDADAYVERKQKQTMENIESADVNMNEEQKQDEQEQMIKT